VKRYHLASRLAKDVVSLLRLRQVAYGPTATDKVAEGHSQVLCPKMVVQHGSSHIRQ
jgi:hypothetical protein